MRKIKEVLRLRFGLGLQQNQISRSCSIGQATVRRYLQKAAPAGLSWPLPEDLDDRRFGGTVVPRDGGVPARPRAVWLILKSGSSCIPNSGRAFPPDSTKISIRLPCRLEPMAQWVARRRDRQLDGGCPLPCGSGEKRVPKWRQVSTRCRIQR